MIMKGVNHRVTSKINQENSTKDDRAASNENLVRMRDERRECKRLSNNRKKSAWQTSAEKIALTKEDKSAGKCYKLSNVRQAKHFVKIEQAAHPGNLKLRVKKNVNTCYKSEKGNALFAPNGSTIKQKEQLRF